MFLIKSLAVLGLCSVAYAAECQKPSPITNFIAKDFSGAWYTVGLETVDENESKHDNTRCGKVLININNGEDKENKWDIILMSGNTRTDITGSYSLPDPKQGLFKMYYTLRNLTYDMTVTCTDYTTYAVSFVCMKLGSESLTGFSLLFARDKTAYDVLVAKDEIKNCFKGLLREQINGLKKISYSDCPQDV